MLHLGVEQCHEMGGCGLQLGDVFLHPSTKERVENKCRDADEETCGGGDKRFGNTFRKLHLPHSLDITSGDLEEGFDHSEHGAEQANHRSDGADVRKVGDPRGEEPGLAGAFRLGDFADFAEGCARIFCKEIESLLRHASHGFVLAVTEGDETEVVAAADHGLGVVHESIADHCVAPYRYKIEKDEHHADHGDQGKGEHHYPACGNDFEKVGFSRRGSFRDFLGGCGEGAA